MDVANVSQEIFMAILVCHDKTIYRVGIAFTRNNTEMPCDESITLMIKFLELNLENLQQICCVCLQKGGVNLYDYKVKLSDTSEEASSSNALNPTIAKLVEILTLRIHIKREHGIQLPAKMDLIDLVRKPTKEIDDDGCKNLTTSDGIYLQTDVSSLRTIDFGYNSESMQIN
uniref:Uncharacterized protein n=1 Tax=Glossina austeni TaxID=7395 RepID=A0A1A9V2F5_GLOAU